MTTGITQRKSLRLSRPCVKAIRAEAWRSPHGRFAGTAASAGRAGPNPGGLGTVAVAPEFALRIKRNELMSRHTSWHVGGPAEVFFNPRDRADLAAFLKALPEDVPIQWIGLGSNLLVRDGGIKGVVGSTVGTLDRRARRTQTSVHGAGGACRARV